MKGLYKKISVGVLALALVLVGSLSQGAMAYADLGQERCQYEIDRCQYELEHPKKPLGSSWEDEYEKERNSSLLEEYKHKYGYIVLGEYKQDPEPGEANYYLKKNYGNIFDLFDCLNNHLENHMHGGIRIYNIGGQYYKLKFEKMNSK